MTNENPLLLTDYKLYFRGYNLHISDVIKKHIFENITKSQLAKDSEYYEAEKVKAFEAGIKEVAEFVESNIPKTLANYVGFWQLWQAQLKEWGIKADEGGK